MIFLKKISKYLTRLLFFPLNLLEKKYILLTSFDLSRYGGGPRYLFEYLNKKKLNVLWVTENNIIYYKLKKKNLPVLNVKNIFKKIIILYKTKIVINSGTGYFDYCGILENNSKVVKICTLHGLGPKLRILPNKEISSKLNAIIGYNKFDYVSFSSNFTRSIIGVRNFFINYKKTILLGNPKNDQFFNKSLCKKKYKEKKILLEIIKKITKNAKIIYYAPTYNLFKNLNIQITYLSNFNFDLFNNFLEKNNLYLIITKHNLASYNLFNKKFSRIFFIDLKKYPLIDNNQLLMEVDCFMTDTSTLQTEAAILNLPQISINPFFSKEVKELGLIENFYDLVPAKKINSYFELEKYVKLYCFSPSHYRNEFKNIRKKYLNDYYPVKMKYSCKKFYNLITKLL